jgi:outer membrane protein OmpA-like peptidoglycan-associated protein
VRSHNAHGLVSTWRLIVVALALASSASRVTAQSAAINRYVPAEHPRDGFMLHRAEVDPHLSWSAALHVDYANDPLVYENTVGQPDSERVTLVSDQVTAHVLGTFALLDFIELAVSVPIHLVMDGEELGMQPTATGFGPGDLRFSGLLGVHKSALASVAVSLAVSAGTAERGDGRPGVAGDSGATVAPTLHGAIKLGGVSLRAEAGARFRDDQSFAGVRFTDVLTYGIGAELELSAELLALHIEAHGESPLDDVGERATSPLGILLGAKLWPIPDFVVGLAGGMGILRGYGSPDARFVVTLGYAHSSGPNTRAPSEAPSDDARTVDEEPPPDVAPANVEPEPIDEGTLDPDLDGIANLDDRCPAVPGSEQEAGCSALLGYDPQTGAITLERPITFRDAALADASRLEPLIAMLRVNRDMRVRVEAHTLPARDRNASPITLSVQRALAVADALLVGGIAAEQLEASGCGDYRPIASQRGSQRHKNERIELWVTRPLPPSGMRSSLSCIARSLDPKAAPADPPTPPTPAPPPQPKVNPAPPPLPAPAAPQPKVIPAPAPAPAAPAAASAPGRPATALAMPSPAPTSLRVDLDGWRIELLAPVRFADDSAELKDAGAPVISELAAILRSNPTLTVALLAHAADDPDAAQTLALTQARAGALRNALVKRGAKREQVRVLGCGHTRPVAPNNVPWGRKKNDRVEVLILDPASNRAVHSSEGCVATEGP